ncbi:MAG TPA: hypothetical protein VEB19_17565, partial [Gemmatimonadaceae bacterium]|nr:hypothetical protein [Gemmatimonadaceae bacterium]
DKLHFFIAPEWQERTDPTTGPILNSTGDTVGTSQVRIPVDSINLIVNALAGRPGFPDAASVGSVGSFPRGNPLTNLMGRLDWSVNSSNRAVFRILDNVAEQDEFSRNTGSLSSNVTQQSSGIRLTSNRYTRQAKNRSLAFQFLTNLTNGMSNEFMAGFNTIRDFRIVPVTAPEISVGVTPAGGTSPSVAVTAGTERFSPGNDLKQEIFELSNNFTYPLGNHTLTLGGRYEQTEIYNYFLSGAGNGAWTFPTIAALQAGTPSAYAFSYANGGDIAAQFRGDQISAYIQDLWNVTPRFAVTFGIRADRPNFIDKPKYNAALDQVAIAAGTTMRTDLVPETAVLWSPRVGFNWDVTGMQTTQVRGNAGIFTGNTPYILIGNAFSNTGLGGVTVACSGAGNVPAFTTDVAAQPTSCLGQPAPTPGNAGTVGVNVTDPNFKYPQNFTTTLGVDHWLPFGILGTFEALYRKDINALYLRDRNLRGPRLVGGAPYTDPNGRILYADTITTSGTGSVTVQNANQRYITSFNGVNFTEGAIELTNAKAGHQLALSSQLKKRFSRAFELTGAYTYMQSRDVQSLTSDRAISNWRFGRQFSGLENDPNDAQVSNFQRPHRFISYGTFTFPWRKNQTDVSAYFEWMSGHSITYVTNNDINGDGIGGNDPIYVPVNPADASEFRLGRGTGGAFALNAADAAVFDRFISMQPCLNSQRGRIMARNSCQAPANKRMDLNVRQTLVDLRGQQLTLQWDVFNFPNLLNKNWGRQEFPIGGTFNNLTALQTASRETGPLNTALWNYNMNTALLNGMVNNNSPWSTNPNTPANNYQMQLTVRYSY